MTIPGHAGDDIPVGTLKSILKAYWAAYVPDLPGCITTGSTLEETEHNIREAIEGHLKTMREFGDAIPHPTSGARDIEIQPAA